MELAVFIYGLKDPRTNKVRYVGQSTAPGLRLRGHLSESRSKVNTPKNLWVKELTTLNLMPEVTILEICGDNVSAETEAKWIRQYWNNEGEILNHQMSGSVYRPSNAFHAGILYSGEKITVDLASKYFDVKQTVFNNYLIYQGIMTFIEPGKPELLVNRNMLCAYFKLPVWNFEKSFKGQTIIY